MCASRTHAALARSVVFLDEKEGLFAGPTHPGENHQEQPVSLAVDGSFDLSTQDDQLVSQQRVFRDQFRFPSGPISERAKPKAGRRWFDPTRKPFGEREKAETEAWLD